jgi:hypothetical protein
MRRPLAEVIWRRDSAHRIPWIPLAGDGSRYNSIMQFIDPSASTAEDEVRRTRSENQKEHIAPHRPSIDSEYLLTPVREEQVYQRDSEWP